MDIINTLIGDEEDLEARLDIRKEFVQMGIIELMEVPLAPFRRSPTLTRQ
jgi:hypothetical protein